MDLKGFADESKLKKIKDLRNELAHGDVMFRKACKDIAPEDFEDMCAKAKEYLQSLVERYEIFLDGIK